MKNYYLTSLLMLLVLLARAQSNDFTKGIIYYNWPVQAMELATDGDRILCVTRGPQYGVSYLLLDTAGNVLSTREIRYKDFITTAQKVQVRLKKNAVYTVAAYTYCDFGQVAALVKTDEAGMELWRRAVDNPGDKPCFMPAGDNAWWVFRDGDTPLKFDENVSNPIETFNAVLPTFDDYLELGNDRYLTYGSAGLTIYDSELAKLAEAPAGIFTQDAALLPNGNIAVLRSGTYLEVYNEALALVHVAALPPTTNTAPSSITVVNDTIQVLYVGEQFTGAELYSLTLDNLGGVPHPNENVFRVFDMLATGDKMLLAGTHTEQVISIKKEPIHRAFQYNFYTDVAVTSLQAPDTLYATINNVFVSYRYSDVKVTVKNRGTQPVERLRLHGFLSEYTYICPTETWYDEQHTFAPLQPGDSITINIPEISWAGPTFSQPNLGFLCLRAILPQDSLDANPEDNKACSGLIPIKTTVSTTQPVPVPIQVAPNPATDQVLISFPEGTYRLQLTDGLGRIVRTLEGYGNQCVIQRENLPGGVFFGRLDLNDRRGFTRILFE